MSNYKDVRRLLKVPEGRGKVAREGQTWDGEAFPQAEIQTWLEKVWLQLTGRQSSSLACLALVCSHQAGGSKPPRYR